MGTVPFSASDSSRWIWKIPSAIVDSAGAGLSFKGDLEEGGEKKAGQSCLFKYYGPAMVQLPKEPYIRFLFTRFSQNTSWAAIYHILWHILKLNLLPHRPRNSF